MPTQPATTEHWSRHVRLPANSFLLTSSPEVRTLHPVLNCYNLQHTLAPSGAVVWPFSVLCSGTQQVLPWRLNGDLQGNRSSEFLSLLVMVPTVSPQVFCPGRASCLEHPFSSLSTRLTTAHLSTSGISYRATSTPAPSPSPDLGSQRGLDSL